MFYDRHASIKSDKMAQPDSQLVPSPAGYNWKPWQLSPYFLVPLITTAVMLFATLEALVQVGNPPLEASTLTSQWLEWYCGDGSIDCPDLPTDMPFYNISDSQKGLADFLMPDELPKAATFVWLYFPTILAVVYGIVWQMVDDEVKRIEPFRQAQRPGGAPASSSIFASYISIPPFLVPLQAVRWRQTAVFLSSMTYVLVGFVTPILQSQMFQIQNQVVQVGYYGSADGFEPLTRDGAWTLEEGPIVGAFFDDVSDVRLSEDLPSLTDDAVLRNVIYLDPTYTRAQEAILLLAAITGSLLLWTTISRQSGMRSSYTGLAAAASLAAPHQDFLDELAVIAESQDTHEAKEHQVRLEKRTVHLGWRHGDSSHYGFWFDPPATTETPQTSESTKRKRQLWSLLRIRPYFRLRYAVLLSIIGNIYFMASILVRGGTEKEVSSRKGSFEKTINSDYSIAIAAIDLIVVSVIKSLWVVVEEHMTELAAFRSLSYKPGKAFPLFSREYTSSPIFLRTWYAMKDKQASLAMVTIVSLLLELGLICFGITASMAQGQGFNNDSMWIVHWIAFTVSMLVFFFAAFVLKWVIKGYAYLWRSPDTIGARLSYLCRSHLLLDDFRPVASMRDAEKERYMQQLGYSYAFGGLEVHSRHGEIIEVAALERLEGIRRVNMPRRMS